MLDHLQPLYIESLSRELRDVELGRPRLDRPEYRPHGRIRSFLGVVGHPPARASVDREHGVPAVTIRTARPADALALARLAELSERRVPRGPVLLAEVDASLVAAFPVGGGPLLHDLRTPTGDVGQLLELRAGQIVATEGSYRAA